MLQLSLVSNMTIQEIEDMPVTLLQEYMALNMIMPFTHDAQAQRDGLLIAMIGNQNVTKQKDLRDASDYLPYLKDGIPEWAEDSMVLHAQKLLKEVESHTMGGEAQYRKSRDTVLTKIQEQIEIELKDPEPDNYRITELRRLVK